MTLQQLRYFVEVVRQDLNISRAAEALHVSQPGLSRQLQLFERELRLELFVRNRKRLVRLSPGGAAIHRIAQDMIESAQNISEAAREHAGKHHGALTIATTHTQARYALPEVIRRFAKRYPQVNLSLRQGTPVDVCQLVASGAADLSIATPPLELPPDLVLLPCYKLERIVLTPAGHPLLELKRLTLEKLAQYPLITYDYAFIGRSKTLGAFEARGITPSIVLNAIDADVIKSTSNPGSVSRSFRTWPTTGSGTRICAPSMQAISSSPTRFISASGAITTCAVTSMRSSRCSCRI